MTKQDWEASDLGPSHTFATLAVIEGSLTAFLSLWLTDYKMFLRFKSLQYDLL